MTRVSAGGGWSLSDTEMFVRYGEACVPRRAGQVSIVCDLLSDLPAEMVLDLCCGEGLLAGKYLRRHPAARVTLLDGPAEMLALASRRLAGLGASFIRVRAGIADLGWRAGERYGAVMTSLAVHHLGAAGKRQLYRDLFRMLLPGGVFVMADLVERAGQGRQEAAADTWQDAVAQASRQRFGSGEALTAFTATEWNCYRLPVPDDFDRPSSVGEHLAWLGEAGIGQADLTWMYAGHAIFTRAGQRSAEPGRAPKAIS